MASLSSLPRTSQTGVNEWSDVETNDEALRTAVNSVDNTQLAAGASLANLASASVTDAKLASPNNVAYRTLLRGGTGIGGDAVAGTYIMGSHAVSGAQQASGVNIMAVGSVQFLPSLIYFANADYLVASKTQKLRLIGSVLVNATAPAITFTVGLYPVTVAGGADALTFTLGTVVPSSTIALASPAASTPTTLVNSDFTIPADGAYALGVVTSGTIANNSAVLVYGYLQTRSV